MTQEFLGERARRLLKALIQEYIQTGEPVGSRRLSRLSEEGLSAATIRNIMSDLEEGGFVSQPHPSAGRLPTEKGYRFYVDALLEKASLSRRDMSEISRTLKAGDPGTSDLMSRASHVLSAVSNNVGFVVAPRISEVVVKHIQFFRLGDRRVLVVLVGESGIVQNRVVHVDDDMGQQELDFTSRYMVANFAGFTLPYIRRRLVELMREEKALYDKLLQKALKLGSAGCTDDNEGSEENVFVEGTSRLMRNPEFADVRRMIEIFEMFEQKSHLVKIISECIHGDAGRAHVTIGLESAASGAGNFAMVASPYMYKNHFAGSLGVLGPMRMEYARAIPLVDYVTKVFEGILNRN